VTGHLVVLVLAAIPVDSIGALMAAQTLACTNLVIRHCISTFLKDDVRRGTTFDVGVTLQVLLAFAVAGLAVRRTGITPDTVLGLVKGKNRCGFTFVVAARADCIPFQGLLRRLRSDPFHIEIWKFSFCRRLDCCRWLDLRCWRALNCRLALCCWLFLCRH